MPQKEEIKQPFGIEVSAPAENTFFGSRNIRPGIFRQDKAAISTRIIPFLSRERKAISRVADRAGYVHFPLHVGPFLVTAHQQFIYYAWIRRRTRSGKSTSIFCGSTSAVTSPIP